MGDDWTGAENESGGRELLGEMGYRYGERCISDSLFETQMPPASKISRNRSKAAYAIGSGICVDCPGRR